MKPGDWAEPGQPGATLSPSVGLPANIFGTELSKTQTGPEICFVNCA